MQLATSIDEFFAHHPTRTEELHFLRNILLETELTEALKWGTPHYLLNKKIVIGLSSFKSYVGLWFHQGVFLNDPYKKLINAQEGTTKGLRQWRFESIEEMNADHIRQYVLEAIENQKAGKEIKPARKQLIIPEELSQAFQTDHNLKLAFTSLTRGKQMEYAEHIGNAKQDATRINRLRKCVPMILSGAGLHDKYKRK